jgi:hypothetical protein
MRHVITLLAVAAVSGATCAQTHCRTDETTYFSCHTSRLKVVSLCGSHPETIRRLSARSGAWLQYRFGVVGKPELLLPRYQGGSLSAFVHEFHQGLQTLRIDSAGPSYTLFTVVNLESGQPSSGVNVESGGKTAVLKCVDTPHSSFYGLVSDLETPKQE